MAWQEVVRLKFKGERFRDHALDLTAVTELRQFQKIVAETAKALWRAANPNRERLPAHFENRTRLCLRKIEEGSAVAPLEVFVEDASQADLWEPELQQIKDAIALVRDVFDSVEHDRPLPERVPKDLVPDYLDWGRTLGTDEAIEIAPHGPTTKIAQVNARSRDRLARFVEAPHVATVEITGQVLEADVRQRHFQLWVDENTLVTANFTEAQEELVTSALKEHRSVRVKVRGRADVSPQGKPLRFTEVEELVMLQPEPTLDSSTRPIEDVLADIATQVPDEQWRRLPDDLTDQLDHYLYGTPKR